MGELFTPRKANRVIGRVEELLTKITQLSSRAASVNGAERAKVIEASKQMFDELEKIGCEVKNLELGLADFPAMRQGQPVYLCWKLGERRVGYWHSRDSGYGSRKPIEEGEFDEAPLMLPIGREGVDVLEKMIEKGGREETAMLPAKIITASQLDLPEIVLTEEEARVLVRMINRHLDNCDESEVQQLHKVRRIALEAIV